MLILITICRIVDGSLIYVCLSAYLQSLFLAARLVLIPFESQQEGTSADHINELVGRCTRFFPLCGYLVHQYLFERPPACIHCHPILGGPLWVRRSPHSTCVDCVYLCFYYVCRMGGSLSKPVKKVHLFIGERTPAQAFSTFCSSTQSTDGWSDTTAFILT